jgi:adenylate cyclase class 2
MQSEIEVRFIVASHDALRDKLRAIGAVRKRPMLPMKRAIMDYPDNRMRWNNPAFWAWIRVRDEGDRTVVTYKQIAKDESKATHEIEYEVSSYDNAIALFEAIGLEKQSVQHTKRETWKLADCEVVLDEWPWLDPIIEIEGPSEASLQDMAKQLGLDWQDARTGNVENIYQLKYPGIRAGESIGDIPELTFETMPVWLSERQYA